MKVNRESVRLTLNIGGWCSPEAALPNQPLNQLCLTLLTVFIRSAVKVNVCYHSCY